MRVFLVLCAIAFDITNTQEYNYNAPQRNEPQQLYNEPSIVGESGNNLNQGYNHEEISQLYDTPQSHPTQLNQGYTYEAPSQLYDAPQSPHPIHSNQGYNYEAPSQLYDAPQSPHPIHSNQGYNYEAPSQLYDAPQSPPAESQGYNYIPPEASRYIPTLERIPTSELSSHGYNYEAPAPSQLYIPPTASSEPVQEQNAKYLPPPPRTTASPSIPSLAKKYLPPKQETLYPEQLSTHLEEIKGANAARLDLPTSYNYKPNQPSAVSVSKHYFIPQSYNQTTSQGYHYRPPSRTHYRVIFIKSPTPEKGQLEEQQFVEEEKTVIYVLNQEARDNKYLPPPNPGPTTIQTKPEVFFLNYKTPEEAAQAQQQIQAHYDALGGGAAHTLDNSYTPPSPALYPETF